MNTSDIKCSKVIPFTGLLSPSPLLNNLHKTAKLEIPEVNDHRKALGNIFNRLATPNIQSLILNNPKLNATVLSEVANNFFTSNYTKKAEALVKTMSMPNYLFENETGDSIKPTSPMINSTQKKIIDHIKANEQNQLQASKVSTSQSSNPPEQGLDRLSNP
ncbi:hypothetical protein [Acinetobacter gyllenbergii]|uniref:hypothetical protein n=1 Tax=Acinetobacter gyllenbergii TaxID=134534 RepID=UPI003F55A27F